MHFMTANCNLCGVEILRAMPEQLHCYPDSTPKAAFYNMNH
jgi:hypothetical protein